MKLDCKKLFQEEYPMMAKYSGRMDWDGFIDFETPEDEAEYKKEKERRWKEIMATRLTR